MRRQKQHHGFTLVELVIIMVVISILASITIVAYGNVQRQARDTKKENDIKILAHAMDRYYEQNGNYPLACSYSGGSGESCAAQTLNYQTRYPSSVVPPLIGPSTTIADLKAIFSSIPDGFGNPLATTSIFNQSASASGGWVGSTSRSTYFVVSQDALNRSYGSVLQTEGGSLITCQSDAYGYDYSGVSVDGTRSHDYILGYYSESEKAWKFFRGPKLRTLNDSRWNLANKPECVATSL